MKRLLLILPLCLMLSACATTHQRNAAVTGGAVGAAAGAVIGSGSDQVVEGAIVGGVIGATAGAIIADPHRRGYRGHDRDRRYGRDHRYYRRH